MSGDLRRSHPRLWTSFAIAVALGLAITLTPALVVPLAGEADGGNDLSAIAPTPREGSTTLVVLVVAIALLTVVVHLLRRWGSSRRPRAHP